MALLHFSLLLLYLLTGALAAPLNKRVTFNYEWALQNPASVPQERQTQVEREFEDEMAGVYDMARVASQFIANGFGARTTTFAYYFGVAPTPLDAVDVRGNYDRVIDLASNDRQMTIRFTDIDSTEHPGAQAYATAGGTITIYLPAYERYTRHSNWAPNPFEVSSMRLESTPTRSLILLHELMHVQGIGRRMNSAGQPVPLADYPYPDGFNDVHPSRVYGETGANRLVQRMGFNHARGNADNVALFAFSLWADQFNQNRMPDPQALPSTPPAAGGDWLRNGSRDAVRTPPRGTRTWWLTGFGHSSSKKRGLRKEN